MLTAAFSSSDIHAASVCCGLVTIPRTFGSAVALERLVVVASADEEPGTSTWAPRIHIR
jgi:hypothetical protein